MKGTKLDPSQAAALKRRLRSVDDRLHPGAEGDPEKITTIRAMFAHYKVLNPDLVDVGSVVDQYLFAVREFPSWAVIDACVMVMAGRVEFLVPQVCPSAHELEKVCHLVVRKLTRERQGLYKALERVP